MAQGIDVSTEIVKTCMRHPCRDRGRSANRWVGAADERKGHAPSRRARSRSDHWRHLGVEHP